MLVRTGGQINGKPIFIGNAFILDFLIPLARHCFKTHRKPPEICFGCYPATLYPWYSLDVGNWGGDPGNSSKRFDPQPPDGNLSCTNKYKTPIFPAPDTPGNKGGNIYIGNGTECGDDHNYGVGRASYYYPDPSGAALPPKLQKGDGTNNTFKQVTSQPLPAWETTKSYPLDNLHQAFIMIYKINQKIMELNHCCTEFDASGVSNPKIPLITNMHYDSEGGGNYMNAKSSTGAPYGSGYCYPAGTAIDTHTGELLVYNHDTSCTSNCPNRGGLGQIVGQGYQKYLFNRYMPAESLPDWRTGNAPFFGDVSANMTEYVGPRRE